MDDLSNLELQKAGPPPSGRESRPKLAWIIIGAVVIVAIGATWFFVRPRDAAELAPDPVPAQADASASPTPPLGAAVEAIELPPLGETDALLRKLVRALSSHPLIAAWLATDGLIRNFTVVVENIADGATPARHLPTLRPRGTFRVLDRGEELTIDPRSYDRYTPLAEAVSSIDADGAARLYSSLKPRIEEAYAELGREGSFDVALEQALVALLRTPALDGSVPLVPKGIVFGFEDPSVERLTPAQKQLARMGPANVRIIQAKLRQIALALGIPAERLPR